MEEEDMAAIAEFIHQALQAQGDADAIGKVQRQVAEFCSQFPLHKPVYEREGS
jgi:glycine hydroxymethyltransferase